MSLAERLTALKEGNRSKMPESSKKVMADDLLRLGESGIVEKAPKVGEKLADFKLSNQKGEQVTLSDLRGKGPVVVTFYRGGWCPYCNLQLNAYQQILKDIKAEGATLVAITPELPDASLSTSEKNDLQFEVLTDINSGYAEEIGIMFTVSEELIPVYESFGRHVEAHNGEGQYNVPLASTFIIDTDGVVTFAFVAVDYTYRAEPADIIKALKSINGVTK